MNVLVCGARGFVGRTVAAELRQRGHRVVEAVASIRGPDAIQVDFARDAATATWLPRLAGIDAVVNAVGVLRDSPRRPMAAVHEHVPRALFEACAQAGVRRFVQVSALGIVGSDTLYARSKLAGEATLAALVEANRLDATIVRPSIVFGRGGSSSEFFLGLARWPMLMLPAPVLRARVQPVAVRELAEVIATLVESPGPLPRLVEAVGPEPTTLAGFIASLRAQARRAPARVGTLPATLTRWSARAGDAVPVSPWCSQTLALLASDNVADPAPFERLLGRRATPFDALLEAAS